MMFIFLILCCCLYYCCLSSSGGGGTKYVANEGNVSMMDCIKNPRLCIYIGIGQKNF